MVPIRLARCQQNDTSDLSKQDRISAVMGVCAQPFCRSEAEQGMRLNITLRWAQTSPSDTETVTEARCASPRVLGEIIDE